MAGYYVKPLCLGYVRRDRSAFMNGKNGGNIQDFPVLAYYIGGGEKHILVDTGTRSEKETDPGHMPYFQSEDQTMLAQLKKINLEPKDIDIVINTHLHWDHCYNNDLFPQATFYVQYEELRYSIAPLPSDYGGYEAPAIGKSLCYIGTKFTVIKGDYDLMPGIKLIFTPGHSMGSMSVLIDCDGKKVLIASDTIGLFECWKGYEASIPSNCHVDLRDYYETFRRIESLQPEIILPGHDQKALGQEIYP